MGCSISIELDSPRSKRGGDMARRKSSSSLDLADNDDSDGPSQSDMLYSGNSFDVDGAANGGGNKTYAVPAPSAAAIAAPVAAGAAAGASSASASFPSSVSTSVGALLDPTLSRPARRFKLREITAATNDFDATCLLGGGVGGSVYRGELQEKNGARVPLAFKKLNMEVTHGFDQWLQDVLLLDKLRHPCLVKLVGYCADRGEGILVFQFCPNGSLDNVLFARGKGGTHVLTWQERMCIAQQTAEALQYLHSNAAMHQDLKPSNILLTEEWCVRITDMRLSKEHSSAADSMVAPAVKSGINIQYTDPNLFETGTPAEHHDVYALGVIMVELVTGRHMVDERGRRQIDLPATLKESHVMSIIDPCLSSTDTDLSPKDVLSFLSLAQSCMVQKVEERPSAEEVVRLLEGMTTNKKT